MNQMTALKNTFHTYLDTDKHDIGLDTNLSSSFIWHSNPWHPLPVSSPSSPNLSLSSLQDLISFIPPSIPQFSVQSLQRQTAILLHCLYKE